MKQKKLYLLLLSTLFSQTLHAQNSSIYEEQTFVIALFLLGFLAIIALFISSVQIKNLKAQHIKMQDKQDSIQARHDELLSDMSKHIQHMAQDAVKSTHELADKVSHADFRVIVNSENRLLGVTNDLVEFLRLKSKKVKVINENFKLLNLLNDTSGTLSSTYRGQNIELNYDINNNIPNTLIGDTLHLNKILVNIFEFCINNQADELLLKVFKSGNFTTQAKLNFSIISNTTRDVSDNQTLFSSRYNESTNKYDSLDLFVAKELSLLMDGNLTAQNIEDEKIEFLLSIPLDSVKEINFKLKNYLENKKVLIIDSNYNSALAIKNIFSNLNYSVEVATKEMFLSNEPNYSLYDIVVLDNKLFNKSATKTLHKLDCKIITVGTIFNYLQANANKSISDIELTKPITRERVVEVLDELYSAKEEITKEASEPTKESKKEQLKVHREIFANTPNVTLERFNEFKGSSMLLVEDNFINQKVLTSVLSKSGINITLASNGQEALDLIYSEQKFDLVLMDINMPVMDGFTATIKIREDSRFDMLPIVSLTALTSKDEVDKMFDSGMNGFLAKPFYKEKLFTVFSVFIANKPVYGRNSAKNTPEIDFGTLNIKTGIKNTDNNDIFYREVLMEFKDAYSETALTVKTLVMEHRFEQLRMLSLDLKGLSGAIGASNMQSLSTEILQLLIFKKYDLLNDYIEKYRDEINKLNNSIDNYLDQ